MDAEQKNKPISIVGEVELEFTARTIVPQRLQRHGKK